MAPNSLAGETSPYLLQHADNPVEWFAWNDAALRKARDEDKPIFLSVGYSACHWCHVMAHESFENDDVAEFMNANFVNIKVDREERPDIDDIYQRVCQTATGQGGWPLSVFLTPDQKPFYVGTYFPALDSHGRPGFGSITRQLAQAWRERPGDVRKKAEGFLATLRIPEQASPSEAGRQVLDEAAVNLFQLGDPVYGGFGQAPKFPNAANISFLFRYARLSGVSKFAEFGLRTLDRMARGGIFDQIGGGFHRYSTDARWLVPHFEKMLYDNALIPVNYAEAYQITKEPFYLGVMQKTLDFVLRDMASPEGGFYSAYDADSEGVEGKYYVWSKGQVRDALGGDADLFCMFYDVTDGGNWEGANILSNTLNASTVAFNFGMTERQARERLEACSAKLLEARSGREAPGLDDKVLTSWNALMVTALAKGYRVAGDRAYLEAATGCLSFIERRLLDGTRLLRTFKDGTAKIDGYLDDYSYLASALLDVFEVHPEPGYLELARRLGTHLADRFWDGGAASFFMTSEDHERLIIRPKSNYDLSLPSGNSVACNVMLRLYHLTQEDRFLGIATAIMESQARAAAENPFGFGNLLNTIYMSVKKPAEITVLNTENDGVCRALGSRFLPESIMVSVEGREQLEGLARYPFFAGKEFTERTTVFVCRDFACSRPLRTAEEVESEI